MYSASFTFSKSLFIISTQSRKVEDLQQLMDHPDHLKAKRQYARWIDAYHVVISQVLRSHGHGCIAHPLSAQTGC